MVPPTEWFCVVVAAQSADRAVHAGDATSRGRRQRLVDRDPPRPVRVPANGQRRVGQRVEVARLLQPETFNWWYFIRLLHTRGPVLPSQGPRVFLEEL